jgi:hypothetical protein
MPGQDLHAPSRYSSHRKAVEVVGEYNRTRTATLYFCLCLILFSQSPQHSMRKYQLVDMSIRSDHPDSPKVACGDAFPLLSHPPERLRHIRGFPDMNQTP